jgi:hypothetical protein
MQQGPYGYGYGAPPPQQHYYPPQPPAVVYVQQQPMFIKAPFNHTVHIILDIVTCGGWVPIHLICWALH